MSVHSLYMRYCPRCAVRFVGRHSCDADAKHRATCDELRDAVRVLREAEGVSQHLLAKASGLTRSTITKMEVGTHGLSVDTLLRVADALGYEVEVRFAKR